MKASIKVVRRSSPQTEPNRTGVEQPDRICTISTSIRAWCDICGIQPKELHLPEEYHGWYCPVHCPACNQDMSLRIPRYIPPEPEIEEASEEEPDSENWISQN